MSDKETPTEETVETPPTSSSPESAGASNGRTSESSAETQASDKPQSEEATLEEQGQELSIHTLKAGQHLSGTVKNITNFGAFVDIGIPQVGLVHISKLARRKVEKVSDVVSEGDEIEVWVKKVDRKRGRISLTMIRPVKHKLKDLKEGADLEGTVTRLESYGAFVDIGSDRDGLVHISQITHEYIKHPEEALAVGDTVNVKVLKVDRKKRQIDLSIKELLPLPEPEVVEKEIEAFSPPTAAPEVIEIADLDEEVVPTAMAVAYAAFQDTQQSEEEESDQDKDQSKSQKRQEEMDSIINRTLASRE